MIAVFGIGPLLDMLFGRDPANPDEETQTPQLLGQGYYVLLTLATVPVLIGTLVWAAGVFVAFQEWGWLGRLGWILSMGTVMGAVGIVVAHELIHKDSALEQAAGGILLAAVCYAGFKVEHVRGHHVHVSTPEDASSARFGQSVYQFLPHAYKYNFLNAWRLEAVRLRKKGLPVFGWQNELIWWYLLSLALLVGFGWAFGWLGMVFFLGQAVRRGDPAGDHQLRRALRPASAKGARTGATSGPTIPTPGTATSSSPTWSCSICNGIPTIMPSPNAPIRSSVTMTIARRCPAVTPGWWCWR